MRKFKKPCLILLGFTKEEAQAQFGFSYGGCSIWCSPLTVELLLVWIVWCAILGGQETIRDFIAFPKNNSGRDLMIDAPAAIDSTQLEELNLALKQEEIMELHGDLLLKKFLVWRIKHIPNKQFVYFVSIVVGILVGSYLAALMKNTTYFFQQQITSVNFEYQSLFYFIFPIIGIVSDPTNHSFWN